MVSLYLEHRFYRLAKDAGRYEVKNGNEPNRGNVTSAKRDELEEFIDYAKMVVGALGHKVFVPIATGAATATETAEASPPPKPVAVDETDLLHLKLFNAKRHLDVDATGTWDGQTFTVLAGSRITAHERKSLHQTLRTKRRQTKIVGNVLQESAKLGSPSAAAGFVLGASYDGWLYWRNRHGTTLRDLAATTTTPPLPQPQGIALTLTRKRPKDKLLVTAQGRWSDGTLTVLVGSEISPQEEAKQIGRNIMARRRKAKIDGGVLRREESFATPSAAAAFVMGKAIDGWSYWRDAEGRSLNQLTHRKP